MKTLTDLLTEVYENTKDYSAENKSRAIRRFNDLQKQICAGWDYFWLNQSYTFTTVSGTQAYQLPPDWKKVVTAKVTIGNISYVAKEIANERKFDQINTAAVLKSDFVVYYHIRFGQIFLYPTPSAGGYTFTILYIRRPREMIIEDYSTGTITATNGNAIVVGSGTSWNSITNKNYIALGGCYIDLNGIWYEIAGITDDTHLTLVKNYQGATLSAITYRLGDCPLIWEDYQNILWYSYVADYYRKKENTAMANSWKNEVKELVMELKESTSSNTTEIYTDYTNQYPRTINNFPMNIG